MCRQSDQYHNNVSPICNCSHQLLKFVESFRKLECRNNRVIGIDSILLAVRFGTGFKPTRLVYFDYFPSRMQIISLIFPNRTNSRTARISARPALDISDLQLRHRGEHVPLAFQFPRQSLLHPFPHPSA